MVQQLTTDRENLLYALWRGANDPNYGAWHETIDAASGELVRARGTTLPDQAVFVVGLHIFVGEHRKADVAADRAKNDGIELFVVGCADSKGLATDRRHYFDWSHGYGDIEQIRASLRSAVHRGLSALDDSVVPHAFETITITTSLPASFAYVSDSARPPAAWDAGTRELTWTFASPPLTTTVGYDVRPLECGTWDLPQDAFAWGRDSEGHEYRYDYVPVEVEVPCATPTPTATVPTPTPTRTATVASATPTPTPADTPTLTSTVRPTREPVLVYLPIALNEEPCTQIRRAAVALVLDTSTSMQEPTASGKTKVEAAKEAAALFIDLLSFPEDQAAIVGFHSTARLARELTSDPAALKLGLASLTTGHGTDIAVGLAVAQAELTSQRRREDNFPVVVLLTDGRTPGHPDEAERVASAAKADGILMFTIGLGEAIDRDQLRQIASKPECYFEAADGDDLADVYRQVAIMLPCPPERHWGGR